MFQVTPPTRLLFYFDYISNNAYLAWTQLAALAANNDLEVELRPVLFAGLLNAHGNVGPAEIPAKRNWMLKNILRKANQLGVPMAPPVHHPFNPLMALRASIMDMGSEQRWQLVDGLFKAVWRDGLHLGELDVVVRIARDAGLDEDAVLQWLQSPLAAAGLRECTQDAVNSSVFGVPTMILGEELFFGYDDFPYIEQYLQGRDTLDLNQLARWEAGQMAPSAKRRTRK